MAAAAAATPAEFLTLAKSLVDISRPILRGYYRTKLDIISKGDESPVTKADRECEAALRAAINKAFPTHGIIGEEYGATREDAEQAFPAMQAMPVPYIEAQDVSNAVVFLASDEARYITSVVLPIDAGSSDTISMGG